MHDDPAPQRAEQASAPYPAESTAVVLGAGGVAGWSFHIGIADALGSQGLALGVVGRVVAVSAGSAIAASLMAGADPEDLMHHVVTPPPPEERERAMAAVREKRRSPARLLTPTSPGLLRRALIGRDRQLGLAVAGLLPTGVFPTAPLRRFPGLEDSRWPAGLVIPAVRLPDGQRVAMTEDDEIPLADAVEASQAVPMMFTPKTIDGHRYIDAATVSSTHADLARTAGIERVIIAAPMLRPGGGLWRSMARRALQRESDALRKAGIAVAVVAPSPGAERLIARVRGRDMDAAHLLRAEARSVMAHALAAGFGRS